MNKQLDAALLESQKMRIEADQANRNYNYMKRENEKLQQETEDLSKQVRGKGGIVLHINCPFIQWWTNSHIELWIKLTGEKRTFFLLK